MSSNSQVLVAGGSAITSLHDQWGAMAGKSCQVWRLDVNSGTWTRLLDLPESLCTDGSNSGFLAKSDDYPMVLQFS